LVFGLFKADPFDNPALGRLERRKGHWRGSLSLPEVSKVDLAIIGDRSAPDPECLAAVRDFGPRYSGLRPVIATELLEHRQNGLDAEEHETDLLGASSIWEKVRTLGVLADRWAGIRNHGSRKVPVVVVEYQVKWDEEHTLGAVIEGDTLIELNGSVLSVF